MRVSIASIAMTNGLDFKPAPTHVISNNSNLILILMITILMITILARITTLPTIIWLASMKVNLNTRRAKSTAVALSPKKLCHKPPDCHDGMVRLLIVTIVMIITEESNTKKVNSIIAFLPRERRRVSRKCGIKFEKKTQLIKIFLLQSCFSSKC